MASAMTLDTKLFSKKELRVVAKDGVIYGLIDGKKVLQGADAETVMENLKAEVGELI